MRLFPFPGRKEQWNNKIVHRGRSNEAVYWGRSGPWRWGPGPRERLEGRKERKKKKVATRPWEEGGGLEG